MYASGNSSRTIAATRFSCSSLRKEKSRQTATESTAAFFSLRTCARTSRSSSGIWTEPSARMRSLTVRRLRRRAIGNACHGRFCHSEKFIGFLCRAMWMMSR